jgi:uncharacterized protein
VRLTVTDLVGRPGTSRAVVDDLPRDAFGEESWGPAAEYVGDPISLDVHLDSVVEGILVRGTITFALTLPCGRCLEPQHTQLVAEVMELFVDPDRADDADDIEPGYVLIDDMTAIDLTTLVRDALLIDLPIRVLCRDDCAGLCAQCGADLNSTDCGHRHEPDVDPRWAALTNVSLPPE